MEPILQSLTLPPFSFFGTSGIEKEIRNENDFIEQNKLKKIYNTLLKLYSSELYKNTENNMVFYLYGPNKVNFDFFRKFTISRSNIEDTLILHKELIATILQKLGSKKRIEIYSKLINSIYLAAVKNDAIL